jgi:Ribonuclease G/E
VSGVRRLFLDRAPGETRGVVVLDGRPERLLIEREGASPALGPGARAIGRVRRIERGLGIAFVDVGEGPEAVLPAGARLTEGQALELEITAPARRGKGPAARVLGPGEGAPRLVAPAPGLLDRLQAFAPGEAPVEGEAAREAADAAEEAALAVEHRLEGGATLAIEPTRALVAVDVDVSRAGAGDPRRAAARANRQALGAAARLLRLKGLGGLVVFDLAGARHDGPVLAEAAKAAFAPDMPGVAFGPVTRLGTFQLSLPWRSAPLAETLCDEDGRVSAETVALRLLRALEREARHAVRLTALCAPEVAEAARRFAPALVARIGPRFDISPDPARPRAEFEVTVR